LFQIAPVGVDLAHGALGHDSALDLHSSPVVLGPSGPAKEARDGSRRVNPR
jgi:hypothetical protein